MPLLSNEDHLVIPYPITLTRQFGALSLEATGMPLSCRLHKDDLDLLRDEASRLGLKSSTLVRWFTVYGAQQLAFVRTGTRPVVRP